MPQSGNLPGRDEDIVIGTEQLFPTEQDLGML